MVNKKGVTMLEQDIKNELVRIQKDVEEIKKILVDACSYLLIPIK